MKITIFDWRDEDSGVAVSFQGTEETCSCYNVRNLSNCFDWDCSIAAKDNNLDDREEHALAVELARSVPYLISLQQSLARIV